MIVAYCVTEPEAGSNVQSLKSKAERILDADGRVVGYKLNGQKQFITNGGVADLYTVLADTPEGPSFFIVEAGTPGLIAGRHEDKHGIRASDTTAVTLQDLCVPAENLVGGVEGQGLKQANQVFGYTRLMVAAFGLGAGNGALWNGRSRTRRTASSSVRPWFKSRATRINSWCLTSCSSRQRGPTSRKSRSDWTQTRKISRSRELSRSTSRPRRATRRPMTASRPLAGTATCASTRSRRSSGTSKSRRSTKEPAKSCRT